MTGRLDPPPRPDGTCAYCGRPRNPWRSAKYAGNAAEQDSFCRTECARAFHGCPLPKTATGPRQKKAA